MFPVDFPDTYQRFIIGARVMVRHLYLWSKHSQILIKWECFATMRAFLIRLTEINPSIPHQKTLLGPACVFYEEVARDVFGAEWEVTKQTLDFVAKGLTKPIFALYCENINHDEHYFPLA